MNFDDLWYGDDVNGIALWQFWLSLVTIYKCQRVQNYWNKCVNKYFKSYWLGGGPPPTDNVCNLTVFCMDDFPQQDHHISCSSVNSSVNFSGFVWAISTLEDFGCFVWKWCWLLQFFTGLQWKYGNGQSAPCHEVLIQTRIDGLISTLQQLQGCKLVLINDSQLSNTAGSKVGNVAYNITGFKEHVLKYLAQYGVQYILKMYRISWKVS